MVVRKWIYKNFPVLILLLFVIIAKVRMDRVQNALKKQVIELSNTLKLYTDDAIFFHDKLDDYFKRDTLFVLKSEFNSSQTIINSNFDILREIVEVDHVFDKIVADSLKIKKQLKIPSKENK